MANGDADTLEHLLDCVERGRNRGTKNPPSICVVPSALRDLSPSSFNPLVVSIGPLHKEDEKTKEFEVLKERYMHDLLRRTILPPEQILKECVKKVNASMDQIRASYAVIISFSDIDLAKMMVIDACFILEFCLKHHDKQEFDHMLNLTLRRGIALDLILIENQIPFFVLRDMLDCTFGRRVSTLSVSILLRSSIAGYVDPFQYYRDLPNTDVDPDVTHDHVLGYLHKYFKPVGNMPLNPTAGTETTTRKELAMKFKSYLIACFSWCQGKPTLLVPTLTIYDVTEPIWRNLIAYEQSFPKVHNYFTSYVIALHYIVHDQEDVATLVELNVLVNHLASNKEAANMLKAISKKCPVVDISSYQELMQLKNYYNSSWLKNLRRLRHTYFSSPWSVIALVAGIILFSLTVVQTVFTIRGPL